MNTLYTIIGLFALGAIIGLYLLTLVVQKKETPKFVAVIHGLFVAVALVMLIVYNSKNPGLMESIVLFVIAALGGIVLFVRDISKKPIPRWLAFLHGVIAVVGFIFLLSYTFSH
jgi:peptidoglycan/LPS O-acetylase OafA/YrhL